ncbi:MAG: histidinol-phosphate transaminase [Candidatus Hadarchaeales archaeon]
MRLLSRRVREFLKAGRAYPYAGEYGRRREVVNLASNESPFGPSPLVLRALREALPQVGYYPDPKAEGLRKAVGRYVGLGGEEVLLGNGSDELMDLLCRALLDPGDRVLLPLPTFSFYETGVLLSGGVPRFYRGRGVEWDPEELVSACRGVKLVFLGRPNNPTGSCLEEEAVEGLLDTGALVVADEAYVEFSSRGSLARWVRRRENLAVLRTFSKAFGLAGLRVGYLLARPELVSVLERLRQPFNVNRLAQVAAEAALRDLKHMKRVVGEVRRERERLRHELLSLGLKVLPSEANFLMVGTSPWGKTAPELCRELYREGILIRDLSGFRGAGKEWVRITVGRKEENERLIEALGKVKGGRK